LGWIAFVGQQNRVARDAPYLTPFVQGDKVEVVGRVIRTSRNDSQDFMQLDLQTDSLRVVDKVSNANAGLRLSLYARSRSVIPELVRRLEYGDRIALTAKLRLPKNFGNPGALDYEGYLRRHGISALGSGKTDSISLFGNNANRLGEWQSKARKSIIARIHHLWPEEQAVLMEPMLIGERASIDRELSASFQKSGTYHVLVVSGMNVGILALVIFWTLKRLHLGEPAASVVTAFAAGAYAFLCDGGAPIVRATLMLSLYLIARLLYRDRSPLNAVGTAAAIVLLADPASLFDASFQLTFICVLVIAGLAVPLLERTSEDWRVRTYRTDMLGGVTFLLDSNRVIPVTQFGPDELVGQ
jgi:competence protein ComEC